MLSREENEASCPRRTRDADGQPDARSTGCRRCCRRRLPAPDCDPVRVMLLGEKLIAFRDSNGTGRPDPEPLPASRRVAVLRPQRRSGPALRVPRLEVRRRRHVRRHAQRARRIGLQDTKSRPSRIRRAERGGIVWAYMGPRADAAAAAGPRGQHAARRRVERHRPSSASATGSRGSKATSTPATSASCTSARCDSSIAAAGHVFVLQLTRPRAALLGGRHRLRRHVRRVPRPDDGQRYWRIAQFLFPFYTMPPQGVLGHKVTARGWVPMDDEHTMFYHARAEAAPPADRTSGARGRRAPRRAEHAAEYHRLARPLPPGRQRAPTTTRSTATSSAATAAGRLHRDPGHPPAGPGHHREHGPHLRPQHRAPGHQRHDGHPRAPAPADGRRTRWPSRA